MQRRGCRCGEPPAAPLSAQRLQGRSPREAYFVKCDRETNPQADVDRGIVNVAVGFAPLKPAEFVILRIQQIAPTP